MVDAMSARSMVEMGCEATTVGPWDLFRGSEHFKSVVGGAGLRVVSANVFDEFTGEPFVEPYALISRAGVTFAVTGVLDQEADIRTHRDVEWLGITIEDPKECLARIMPEMREKADFVILLSQLNVPQTNKFPEKLDLAGIDFIVVGSNPRHSAQAYEIETAVLIQPGYKGQRLSDLRLRFNAEGVYEGYSGETTDLGERVPSDAAMALKLKEHKIAIDTARKERAAAARPPKPPEAAPAYVEECLGSEASCARCHAEQKEHWLTTAHAHAYDSLEGKHEASNPECLRCHSTCYFEMPLDGSVSVAEHLRNVQCEACHGIATDHARDGSYGGITEATCVGCHDEENSPDFDFGEYLSRVVHQ
jgi:hypothetical protein